MGEYAEMMLDGTCCAGCGEFLLNDDPLGIPDYCSEDCAPDGHIFHRRSNTPIPHDSTLNHASKEQGRLERHGCAVKKHTDFHFEVTSPTGIVFDIWPTAGKASEGKWKRKGEKGKANISLHGFYKHLKALAGGKS